MYRVKEVVCRKIELPIKLMFFVGSITFAIFITLGAFVYIPLPFTPVPITLQVLFVLLAGVVLGEKYGMLSVIIYIFAGVMGLPVFAGGTAGFARLLGPTGGYIVGFLIAPIVVCIIRKRFPDGVLTSGAAMLLGLLAIYIFGVLHFSVFLGGKIGVAVKLGIVPFVIGDILKVGLATLYVYVSRRKAWIF